MSNKTITSKIDQDKLTVSEFLQLQEDAIRAYNDACWLLADVLAIGKKKFGRTQLMELTPLSLTRVQWFVAIASLKNRNPHLLVDHHIEVVGNPKANYWLKKAKKERLKPIQLRQMIRKQEASYQRVAPIKNLSEYPKYMDLIERELKRMSPEEKEKARFYLTSKVSSL